MTGKRKTPQNRNPQGFDSAEPFIFSCGYVPPESLHCRRSDRNYAFQLPFSLIFSKTFSLSSQLQNIDKKGNYKAVDKIRK